MWIVEVFLAQGLWKWTRIVYDCTLSRCIMLLLHHVTSNLPSLKLHSERSCILSLLNKIDIFETCVKLVWPIINMHINLLYTNHSRTQANTRHTLRMPYDPKIGDQQTSTIASVSFRIFNRVKLVDQNLPRAHSHLPLKKMSHIASN